MRLWKKTAALLLAISFLTPTLSFIACNQAPQIFIDSSSENLESTDSSEILPPDETPPATEEEPEQEITQPSAPQTPPNNQNGTSNNTGNTSTAKPTESKPQYLKATGNNLNLRSGAGTDYTVVGQAQKGEIYAIVSKTGEWYKT